MSILKECGFDARRGQQRAGGPDSPDVICESMPDFHAEVKRVERLNIYEAYAQAKGDAGEQQIPYVAHRKNHKKWLVTISGDDFLSMVMAWNAMRELQ